MSEKKIENDTTPEPWISKVKRIPDIFLAVSLGAIVLNDLLTKFFALSLFTSTEVMKKLAAPIIVSVVVLLYRLLYEIKEDIRPLHRLSSSVIEVLPGEGSIPCAELIRNCRHIDILTLSGSVMIPLDDSDVMSVLNDQRRSSRVRCLIANPLSPAIKSRYANDEPDYKENGIDAIEHRLCWLFNLTEKLEAHVRPKIQVRVYDSYPMISVFRADDIVYSSYYGYKLRGNDTPCLRTEQSTYFGKSVLKHYEKLFHTSMPLAHWVETNYSQLKVPESLRFSGLYSGIVLQLTDGRLYMQMRDKSRLVSNPGMLSVFGGRANKHEKPIETAIRELREETTLRVREDQLRLLTAFPRCIPGENDSCVLCTYYLLQNVDPLKIVINEGAGQVVLTREQALEREDLTEDPRIILRDFMPKES